MVDGVAESFSSLAVELSTSQELIGTGAPRSKPRPITSKPGPIT